MVLYFSSKSECWFFTQPFFIGPYCMYLWHIYDASTFSKTLWLCGAKYVGYMTHLFILTYVRHMHLSTWTQEYWGYKSFFFRKKLGHSQYKRICKQLILRNLCNRGNTYIHAIWSYKEWLYKEPGLRFWKKLKNQPWEFWT